MKKLLLTLALALLLFSCNNGGVENTLQKEIDDSFKEDNPFLGTWAPTDNSEPRVVFSDDNIVRAYHTKNDCNAHDPFFYATYTFDGNILKLLHTYATFEYPYDFSNKHIFIFADTEIKKISVKF